MKYYNLYPDICFLGECLHFFWWSVQILPIPTMPLAWLLQAYASTAAAPEVLDAIAEANSVPGLDFCADHGARSSISGRYGNIYGKLYWKLWGQTKPIFACIFLLGKSMGKSSISGCFFVCEGFFLVKFDYPLIICYIAIEHGHRNTGFSH